MLCLCILFFERRKIAGIVVDRVPIAARKMCSTCVKMKYCVQLKTHYLPKDARMFVDRFSNVSDGTRIGRISAGFIWRPQMCTAVRDVRRPSTIAFHPGGRFADAIRLSRRRTVFFFFFRPAARAFYHDNSPVSGHGARPVFN